MNSWRLVCACALLAAALLAPAAPVRAADEDEAKREAPQLDAETGKRLNEALELLNDEQYGAAQAAIAKLDLETLSPYERSRVEQILAAIDHSREDYAGARRHLALALDAGGLNAQESVQIKFQIAQLLLADERWKEGAAALEEWFGLADKPNSAAYYMLASAYYQLEDYARALPPAKKAVELSDKPLTPWVELLLALYLNAERWAEAIPMLERMIASAPDNKTYWQQLWSVYGQQQQYAKALVIMELAAHAGLLREGDEMLRMAEQMLYVGMPYRAAEVLSQAVERKQLADDAEIHQKIGNAWLAAREFGRAIPPLERAYALSGNADIAIRVGEIHLQESAWSEAEQAFTRALAKGKLSNRHNAELLLGIALYSQDRHDDARPHFERAAQGPGERQMARGYLRMLELTQP